MTAARPIAATGRAWVFGDDLNTDLLAPGAYMKFGIAEIARHCLESVDPGFAAEVKRGDIVFAGRNFGAGSSREQAAECCGTWGSPAWWPGRSRAFTTAMASTWDCRCWCVLKPPP